MSGVKLAPVLNRSTLVGYQAAVGRLTSTTPGRWGKLTAHEMLTHLRVTMEISTGDRPTDDFGNAFTRNGLVRWLVVRVLPWPKGKIAVPSVLTPPPVGEFLAEQEAVIKILARFVDLLEADPKRVVLNPGFGRMSLSFYAYVNGKHVRHHLRQFGLIN